MNERRIEHGKATIEIECSGNLGWRPKTERLEVQPGFFIQQTVAEICKGCGAEKELVPEENKWVWHKESCQNPGNLKGFPSHGPVDEGLNHRTTLFLTCLDCSANVEIQGPAKPCACESEARGIF